MTLAHEDTVVTWNEPAAVAVRGTLVVLPGRGESPDVYERFGRRLAADAYRVHVVSAPTDSTAHAHEQLVATLSAAAPDVPRVVVGSDAGAAYAVYLAAHGQLGGVSALVLAGLPTTATTASAGSWQGELDVRTACSAHRSRITEAGVRPAELFANVPAEWLVPSLANRIDVPVLGLHGAADSISPLAEARRWYAGVRHAELVSITGGRHDALNDQTHRTAASTTVLFLERLRLDPGLAPIAVSELNRAEVRS